MSSVTAEAMDEYVIEGLPVGTPVQFRAILRIRADYSIPDGPFAMYGSSDGRASIGESAPKEVQTSFSLYAPDTGPMSLSTALVVQIENNVGKPFLLRYTAWASTSFAEMRVDGRLDFEGLPTGARIVSCQGFTSDTPVQATSTTWGAVKALYR